MLRHRVACAVAVILISCVALACGRQDPSAPGSVSSPQQLAYLAAIARQRAHPSAPAGYQYEGWRVTRPVVFCANSDGREASQPLERDIAAAILAWYDAIGHPVELSIGGSCPGLELRLGDGRSEIGWNHIGGLAVGQAAVRRSDGVVTEADIELERDWPGMSQNSCRLTVLIHEIGHVLGLDHAVAPESVMAPSVPCGRGISMADADAMRRLYQDPPSSCVHGPASTG